MSHNTKIINQLRALVLLTQTEEQVARTRISQARTDAVRRELTQNADNAAKRSLEITEQLRSLGGVPDVVTPALGRLSAILKATFEQAAPFEEALLTDLQLEHQLLDRATYVKVLADQAGDQGPPARREAHHRPRGHRRVADRRARRGGHGWPRRPRRHPGAEGRRRRGPRRQRPGPLLGQHGEQHRRHREAGRRGDLRAVQRRHRAGLRPDRRRPRDPGRRPRRLAERAEQVADREGNKDAAKAAQAAREELGDVSADELPIKNYDDLTVADAIKAIKGLKTPEDIHVVIHYEEAHKNRSNVASAAQTQLADLAKEAVGVSS